MFIKFCVISGANHGIFTCPMDAFLVQGKEDDDKEGKNPKMAWYYISVDRDYLEDRVANDIKYSQRVRHNCSTTAVHTAVVVT